MSAALEMQGNEFKGRKLRVSKASKQQQPQRSNGSGKKPVATVHSTVFNIDLA